MARMKPKSEHKKTNSKSRKGKLDRKEMKHLVEYGEAHPIEQTQEEYDTSNKLLAKRALNQDSEKVGRRKKIRRNIYERHDNEVEHDMKWSQDEPQEDSYSLLLKSLHGEQKETSDTSESESDSESSSSESNDLEEESSSENDILKNITHDKNSGIIDSDIGQNENNINEDELEDEFNDDDVDSEETEGDPFLKHLDKDYESSVVGNQLEKKKQIDLNWPQLGKCLYIHDERELSSTKLKIIKDKDGFYIRNPISENMSKTILTYDKERSPPGLNSFQNEMLSIISGYKDILFTERTFKNGEDLRLIYSAHALNHIFKTRSLVIHHNSKLRNSQSSEMTEYRDQGLTRPKVLILAPFRESALRIVKMLILLMFGDSKDDSERKANVMNISRFIDEFNPEDDGLKMNKKPADYQQIFDGNTDDSFRVGIAVTKKSLKLFADFYSSDILVCSPLGLRTIIGAQGDQDRDFDFLSSIEVVILDQADIFLMQNWEHVIHIMNHLHLQPSDSHGVDFSRVRMWTLEGMAKFYRQTLIFSSICSPTITSFFSKYASNYEGQVIVRNPVSVEKSAIQQVYIQCQQIFIRFACSKITNAPEERFKFFTTEILPKLRESQMRHILIYIPSYFDYVRIRNYFRKEEIIFTQMCEYSKEGKIAKARSMFFHGGRYFLLYTERFHFYHRYSIKGIRQIIFYEMPTFAHFYNEMCNLMHPSLQGKKFTGDESGMNCTVLYNKFDAIQLSSIVGNEKASSMLTSSNHIQTFVTESK